MIKNEVKISTAKDIFKLASSRDSSGFANAIVNYAQEEYDDEGNLLGNIDIPIKDVNLMFKQGMIPIIEIGFIELDIIFPEGKTDTLNNLLDTFNERDLGMIDGKDIHSAITITPTLLTGENHIVFEDMFLYSASATVTNGSIRVLKMLFYEDTTVLLSTDDFNFESIKSDVNRELDIEKPLVESDYDLTYEFGKETL